MKKKEKMGKMGQPSMMKRVMTSIVKERRTSSRKEEKMSSTKVERLILKKLGMNQQMRMEKLRLPSGTSSTNRACLLLTKKRI